MKRKISLTLVFILLIVLVFAGCKKGGTVTTSPILTVKPAATVTLMPTVSPVATPVTSPATTAGTITGFQEGKTVDIKTVPAVEKAILAKYPNVTIKSVTYAKYMNQEAYKVTFSGAADGTTEAYVDAAGKIITATTTASPAATK